VTSVVGQEVDPSTLESAALAGAPRRRRRRQRQLSLVEDMPRPVVKWAGGKGALLPDLVARMPVDLSGACYFEPFVGGGALFFKVLPIRSVISDTNADLVELYQEVSRDPAGLREILEPLFAAHADNPDASYYAMRDGWNSERHAWLPAQRAATLLYLNRTCFNGLFRVNKSGRMNTPIGRASNGEPPRCPSMAHLSAASMALRGSQILCADYVDVVAQASRGDFVYVDPPYLEKSTSANFTGYTSAGFSEADHDELGRHMVALVDRGVRVMVSSADVPGARERYPGFAVHELTAPRAIAASGRSRERVGELILTGGFVPVPAPIPIPTPEAP